MTGFIGELTCLDDPNDWLLEGDYNSKKGQVFQIVVSKCMDCGHSFEEWENFMSNH